MARLNKGGTRFHVNLARDAFDLLEEYCNRNRFDRTYALENMIRLYVPLILGRSDKSKKRKSSLKKSPAPA